MRAYGSDRGSATVWSLAAIAVLCVVFGIVLALGQAVVVRHHAARGADMAALAAADHWPEGGTAACEHAGRVARAQGVRLVRCALDGEISDVTAASSRGPFTTEVRARAGPAGTDPALPPTAPAPTGPSLTRASPAATRPALPPTAPAPTGPSLTRASPAATRPALPPAPPAGTHPPLRPASPAEPPAAAP